MDENNSTNQKTILQRRSTGWSNFLEETINKIQEVAEFDLKITKPQIERLILHHLGIRIIQKDIINGFRGITKIKEEVKKWING